MSTPTPTATASGWLRWSRAVIVSVVATTLGVLAHVSAGGLLPSVPALAVLAGCVAVVSAAALGRPSSRMLLVALVAGGQFVVHLVLTAAAGHTGSHAAITAGADRVTADPGGGPVRRALTMASDQGTVVSGATGPGWLDHVLADVSGAHAAMAVGHLAAACLVAWWLWVGEDALWSLLAMLDWRRRVALSLVTSVGVAASEPDRIRVPVSVAVLARWRRAAAGGPTGRRGPPVHPARALSAAAA